MPGGKPDHHAGAGRSEGAVSAPGRGCLARVVLRLEMLWRRGAVSGAKGDECGTPDNLQPEGALTVRRRAM
ncbi:hypothetical protein [Rhodovulum sulfidophilum]|uniref:Uncharacterized protein n=1 Tax=Rhodovulum sulfidophilum TaxID=35806 RepID=A0ABS1RQX0_RHOSU|nr:hypothetical protein [Rhodovulum sulfidophilum]MBL3608464.1 hypothetical protein [Rhodovulum sulfidophilum]